MHITIANILDIAELKRLRAVFDTAEFVDGRATAGWAARDVKDNEQARGGTAIDEMKALIERKLAANALFQMAARPARLTPILFARYEPGMTYGAHVDDPLMHGTRTDLSWTLWLDDPDSYEGGELVIESAAGETPVKGPAGSIHLYPSTTLHRVDPVRSGTRRVAVGWVQSRVRQAERREILFDLDTARRGLFEREGKTREFDLLSKSFANLLRMWADA